MSWFSNVTKPIRKLLNCCPCIILLWKLKQDIYEVCPISRLCIKAKIINICSYLLPIFQRNQVATKMEMKVCLFLKNHYLFNGGPKRRIKVLLLDKKKYTPMNQDRWYGGVRGRDKKNKSNRKKCEWVLGKKTGDCLLICLCC